MICPVCKGAQNLVSFDAKRGREYWPCPCCHGAGVTVLYSHPIVNNRKPNPPLDGGGAGHG